MGVRTKTLVTVILAGLVIGVFIVTTSNNQLFKGLIFGQDEQEQPEVEDIAPMADLEGSLEIILPETAEEDLVAEVTIENVGEGGIQGGIPFIYSLWINDMEVFSNSDSYSELEPGDAFSFKYPISKTIYQYPDEGTIKLIIDTDNTIEESNENNNEIEKAYKL